MKVWVAQDFNKEKMFLPRRTQEINRKLVRTSECHSSAPLSLAWAEGVERQVLRSVVDGNTGRTFLKTEVA
jgi:hypothetical protein